MTNLASSIPSLAPLPNNTETDVLATFCKAAGDSLRLNILRVLRQNAYGVMELSHILGVKQSGMSHHLKTLAKSGLVSTRREGNTIFYRRAMLPSDAQRHQLQQALMSYVDSLPLDAGINGRIEEVNTERTAASTAFFTEKTEQFRANQDLIASVNHYGDTVANMLDSLAIDTDHALEIGPGDGQFLPSLASRFTHVTALDTSAQMLSSCRQRLKNEAIDNVQLIEGDTALACGNDITADVITMNMVLHHIPDPAQIFFDIAHLLRPEGQLLLSDLCLHNQTWAQETCGDLWLGFEPEDLSVWATSAGLTEGESVFIAQRNGFQIQIRQFSKSENV